MSAAQDYYNQVLGIGHSPENALAYTRQHYPDFVPGVAEAVPAPVPAPVSQQPIPAAQPVAEPAVAAAPVALAPAGAVPAPAASPHAYTPMATPLPGHGTTPMMWGAVACIAFALLLSMAGQFSHGWLVNNEDEGFQAGLRTLEIDCSQEGSQADIDTCKNFAYAFLADDLQEALASNTTASSLDDVQIGSYENYCKNVYEFSAGFAMGNQSQLNDIAKARDTCLETPAAGSTGGMVLWVASFAALLGTVMLASTSVGRQLPANAEQHGKWAATAAGVLMLIAVLVWWMLLPETETDTSAGMGVWMSVLGGVLGVVAGVLAFLDRK